jgi:hypothetical protein
MVIVNLDEKNSQLKNMPKYLILGEVSKNPSRRSPKYNSVYKDTLCFLQTLIGEIPRYMKINVVKRVKKNSSEVYYKLIGCGPVDRYRNYTTTYIVVNTLYMTYHLPYYSCVRNKIVMDHDAIQQVKKKNGSSF